MCANKLTLQIICGIITCLIVLGVIFYLYPNLYAPQVFTARYRIYNNKPKLLIVWRYGLGERELGERIMNIMPRLGVNVRFVCAPDGRTKDFIERGVGDRPLQAARAMQPDMILTIDRSIPPIPGFTNYVVMDQRAETYIKIADGKPVFIQPYHYDFTGIFPTFPEIDLLAKVLEGRGKKYRGFNWRPTVNKNNYTPQEPKRLFFPAGALSDPTRSSDKYKQVYAWLDANGYFEAYGWQKPLQFLKNSYRGFIPIDGESLIKINNAAGISLILHAVEHLYSGTPTGRIFESAAANTVIISDKHKFIMDHFGDNVLYIDVDVDAQTMFNQIDAHMQWIYAHPEAAKQMAQRCHDIFMQKFTLEELMQNVVRVGIYDQD